jgi:subfamily B ATP-binding cassette protein MsbA
MGLSALTSIPLAFLDAAPLLILKSMVDDLMIKKDASSLIWLPAQIIAIFALKFLFRFAHSYSNRLVVIHFSKRLRHRLFQHLTTLSVDHFSERGAGDILARMTSDISHIENGVGSFTSIIRQPIAFIVLIGSCLHTNFKLTLTLFVALPLLASLFIWSGKYTRRKIHQFAESHSRTLSTLHEAIAGFRTLTLFGLRTYILRRFRDRLDASTESLIKISRIEEISHPMVELITSFAIALVLYLGGKEVLNGTMTSGELVAFFTAFGMLMNPIRALADLNLKVNQASAAVNRVFDVFHWKTSLLPHLTPNLEVPKGSLVFNFENVSFSYPESPEREVLKGVSFQLEWQKKIALVGPSGSGKSSLVGLITRLYDPTHGRILLNGQDIRHYRVSEYRKLFGVVSQDVFLFNESVAENIQLGSIGAKIQQIESAADHSHSTDFLSRFPEGIFSNVGERGQKLSGGERQRISVARAFLRNAPVLILDEATSNLDSESERVVQESISELMSQKSTLVVAHRLSTIRSADEILVIQGGSIYERGTHSDLLEKEGLYAMLWNTQSGDRSPS